MFVVCTVRHENWPYTIVMFFHYMGLFQSINVDVRPLVKPSLEASWSEQILVTPIKPKMFPHSAIPAARPRSAEIMTRSLNPQFDGLSSGLRRDPMVRVAEPYCKVAAGVKSPQSGASGERPPWWERDPPLFKTVKWSNRNYLCPAWKVWLKYWVLAISLG